MVWVQQRRSNKQHRSEICVAAKTFIIREPQSQSLNRKVRVVDYHKTLSDTVCLCTGRNYSELFLFLPFPRQLVFLYNSLFSPIKIYLQFWLLLYVTQFSLQWLCLFCAKMKHHGIALYICKLCEVCSECRYYVCSSALVQGMIRQTSPVWGMKKLSSFTFPRGEPWGSAWWGFGPAFIEGGINHTVEGWKTSSKSSSLIAIS